MIVRQPLSPFSHAANIITVNGKRYRATVRGGTAQNTEALQQLAQAVLNGHQGCKKIVVRKTTVIYTNSSNPDKTEAATETVQRLFQEVFRSTPPTTRPASPRPAEAPQEVVLHRASSPVPTQRSLPEKLSLTIPKPPRPITSIDCVIYPSLATGSQTSYQYHVRDLCLERGYIKTPITITFGKYTGLLSVLTRSDQQPDAESEPPARRPAKISSPTLLLDFGSSVRQRPTTVQSSMQKARALASASLLVQSQRQ